MNIDYHVIIVVKVGLNLIRFYDPNFVLYFDNKAIFHVSIILYQHVS